MEKISVSDLSIGDWVYHDDIVFGREIAKVHRLSKDKHGETIGITVYRSDGEFGIVGYICTFPTNNDIQPIPITAEVLEKNGLHEAEFGLVVKPKSNELCASMGISIGIQYIHELQHILRLTKTDKEIVL